MAFSQPSGSSDTARTPKGKLLIKTESKELAKANGDRLKLIVTNEGEKGVWLALGGTAVAKEGIPLAAKGVPFALEGYSGAVSVIAEEGESNVCYVEI